MPKKLSLGFIGAGKMAAALMIAIRKSGIPCSIIASDRQAGKLKKAAKAVKAKIAANNQSVVKKSDIIFLCMKPQDIDEVLDDIKSLNPLNPISLKGKKNVSLEGKKPKSFKGDKQAPLKGKLIVSIAAGIRIGRIAKKLPNAKIIRVMPNTPCLVGEMAAGFSAGKGVDKGDIEKVSRILNSAGKAFLLPEKYLDAVTAVSGSGPAFFAYLFALFMHAGKKYGLPKKIARELVLQTAKGTAALLEKTGMEPDELIAMVSSPNGTTIAGRKVLEHPYTARLIRDTVAAAVRRSREMGR